MPTIRESKVDPRQGPDVSQGVEVPLEAATAQASPDFQESSPPFLLYWKPGKTGSYSVRNLSDGTPVLVPTIRILGGHPGVGDVAGDPGLDFSKAVANIIRHGGIVLDGATCRRHGLPSYLRAHPLARKDGDGNRKQFYLPPWRYPHRSRDGSWEVLTDEDMKTRWEEALLQKGVIPAPEERDLLAILEGRRGRIARHVNQGTEKDRVAYQLESQDLDREILALTRAGYIVDDLAPEATPEPPPPAALPEVHLESPPEPEAPASKKATRG